MYSNPSVDLFLTDHLMSILNESFTVLVKQYSPVAESLSHCADLPERKRHESENMAQKFLSDYGTSTLCI